MLSFLFYLRINFQYSVSIPASSAFTPTGELAVGEKEVEEAKKKGKCLNQKLDLANNYYDIRSCGCCCGNCQGQIPRTPRGRGTGETGYQKM